MIDPIVALDGHTYCRFSAFLAIDRRSNIPGCDRDKPFAILGEMLLRLSLSKPERTNTNQ